MKMLDTIFNENQYENESIYLKIDTNHEGSATVEVFNIGGQNIIKKNVDFVKGNPSEIEVSRLPKGVYIVRVNDKTGSYSKKVLKQ